MTISNTEEHNAWTGKVRAAVYGTNGAVSVGLIFADIFGCLGMYWVLLLIRSFGWEKCFQVVCLSVLITYAPESQHNISFSFMIGEQFKKKPLEVLAAGMPFFLITHQKANTRFPFHSW